ncbi:DUF3822 family protein [Pedobacter sp. MW01-1-1]|uniref:DUF3822 family protein n=1 Tax=Pedobacter sp. MW01-1-1 TaxID=3383027 RepID=UPI003FF1483D
MSKNSLLLVDPGFSSTDSIQHHLLLKVTNDSFSYAIVDKSSHEIRVIFDKQGCENVARDLQEAREQHPHLQLNFEKVKVAVHTPNFIFVPNDFIQVESLNSYRQYLSNASELHTQSNDALGFQTVFAVDKSIQQALPANAQFFPQSATLLALANAIGNDGLLIDFTSASFNVLYVKGGVVTFQNHYESETAEEFNYFLLLIIEQLALTESIPVYLQGIVNEDDAYYTCLLKYFNQLYFFLPVNHQESELLADMPAHYFSGLVALDLCE